MTFHLALDLTPLARQSRRVFSAIVVGGLALTVMGSDNGTTQCASVSSAGVQGNGNSYWGNSASDRYISEDGRFVAFHSESSNLAPGDAGFWSDVFVRDTVLGTTECVSVSNAGVYGTGASRMPSISADGRFVAFDSDAANLVAGDTNNQRDVFVRDRLTGTTEIVSLWNGGVQANNYSQRPSISADGRFVAFESVATNWIPFKTFPVGDIFVRDRQLGTTEWVSPNLSGLPNNNHHSGQPSISDDGRFVAFASLAGGLAPTSFNTTFTSQVYVRDRQTATSEWISVCTVISGEACDSYEPSISGDGRFVAYESDFTAVVPNDTNGLRDVFVRDRQTGLAERVNVSSNGAQAVTVGPSVSTGSSHGSISRDGRYVAFDSYATNLDPIDVQAFNFEDIFVRDRQTGVTTLVSKNNSGVQGSSSSENPAISADGSSVAFASFATNFMPVDINFAPDIFVRMRGTSITQPYCTAGTSSTGCVPSISGSGVASASAGVGFTLSVTGVDGQRAGLVFYGIDGPLATPWGPGGPSFLCVKAPTQRMSTHNSGGSPGMCDGLIAEDWNAFLAANSGALGQPFTGGETVWAQGWFRDPPAQKTTSLSNGLIFTVAP
jgi:Tol biopolymer transport system component